MGDTALVTNFNYKNALAAVRALGINGIKVVTCGPSIRNRVASFSNYCVGSTTYTSPNIDMRKFVSDIKKIIKSRKYNAIVPIGVDTTIPCSYYKEELSKYTNVPVANYDILEKAHDKFQAIEIAKKVNVPVPKTTLLTEDVINDETFKFPAIVKARKGASGSGTRYANSFDDLKKIILEFKSRSSNYIRDFGAPMIQEYISGDLLDVCVLFNHGEPRATVAQRRVITYPPSGGVGIVNETIEYPHLIDVAVRLLREIRWHGVAQVEFKLDDKGVPRLMEINPKFWGTLELSISAGVNMPYLLYRMTMDGDVDPCLNYKKGLQIWWYSAHFPQLFLALVKDRKRVMRALNDKNVNKISDINFGDFKPHIMLTLEGIVRLSRFKNMLRHPLII